MKGWLICMLGWLMGAVWSSLAASGSNYEPPMPIITESHINLESDCADPLSCWLEDLVFQIPDTCFDVEGTECCITEFVCTGISISGIDSTYTSPTTLFMELEGLGTPCSGKWSYGRLGGTMEAVISNTDISTTMVVGKEGIYPVSFEFSTCAVPSIDIALSFKGGLVGWLLDLISGKVEDGLEKAIFTVVCEKGEPTLAAKITETLLETIDPQLTAIVETGPAVPGDFDPATHIDWSTSLPGLFSNIEEKHANDLLNKFINAITNGTGVFFLDLNDATIVYPIVDPVSGPLGNVSLIMHSLQLSGMNAFYDISLLVPSPSDSVSYSPYSIWSSFSIHTLDIALDMTVDVVLDQQAVSGGDLTERFTLDLSVSDTTLGMDLLLPINTVRLGELFLDQALDVACLLSTADDLSVTSLVFKTHIDSFTVDQTSSGADSMEQDIDDLINNIIALGVDGFPELLTGLFSGFAQGVLRDALNDGLSALLIGSPQNCVPHSEATDDEFIVWFDSTLVTGLDYFLNTLLGPSGMNDMVDKATEGTGSVTIPISVADISLLLFGLDTFYTFKLLSPSTVVDRKYSLDTALGVGFCAGHSRDDICTPIGLSLLKTAENDAVTGTAALTRDSALSLELFNFDLTSSLLAKFNMKIARNLQISDLAISSGTRAGCLISAFDSLAIESLDMSVSEALVEKGALVHKEITQSVQKVLDDLSSPKALDAINGLLSKLLAESVTACENGEWPPIDTDDDDFPTPTEDCEGPVQCGLNSIVIGPLGDLCIDLNDDTLQFCVKAFSCYDMDVVGMQSGNPSPTVITLGVEEFAITCAADWSIGGTSDKENLKYEGSFSVAIADFTGSLDAVFGTTTVKNQYPPIPESVKVQNCQTSGTQIKIEFVGGVIGSLLNRVVAPPLEDMLESAVYWALCDILDPFIARLVTRILKKDIDPAIEQIIDMAIPPPPVKMPGYLSWNTTILSTIHNIIDLLKVNEGDVLSCMIGGRDGSVVPGYDVNSLIDYLTDGSGLFDIYIGKTIAIGDATLEIETLTISGLDTFNDIFLLDPSSDSGVTLKSSLGLESLDIQLLVKLTSNGDNVYQQEAVIDLLLTNATLAFDLVVALKLSVLDNLFMDQVLNIACLESALDELYVSSLELLMNVEHLTIQQISGGDATPLEEDTVQLINSLFTLLLSGFPDMTTDIIAGIAQGPIKSKINAKLDDLIATYEQTHAASCTTHVNYTSVNWVEWETSALINTLDNIFNSLLGADGVNKFMNCLTEGTGEIAISLPDTSPIFAGWTITLGGLNSFFDFALVYPLEDEPYDLGNLLGMGQCTTNDCNSFYLQIEGQSNGRDVNLKVSMDNLRLYLDLLMELDQNAIKDLTLGQFHTDGCTMSTVDALAFYDLSISLTDAELYFNGGADAVNMTGLFDKILAKITSSDMLNRINANINSKLSVSSDVCAGTYVPTVDDGNHSDSNNAWRWELAALIAACVVALFVLIWIYFNYGVAGISRVCMNGEDTKSLAYYESDADMSKLIEGPVESTGFFSTAWFTSIAVWATGTTNPDYQFDALIAQDKIYPLVRLLIPFALLGNIALFLSANIAVGATVKMEIDLGDQVITPDPIFEFGLANTVRDMWNAKVYPLSILIAFFSGAWPYIKLAAMFLSWILPTSVLPLKHRDSGLIWLDVLGKWSLIDTYVMVLMMVAFQFTLDLAPGLEVKVIVEPNWGFYAFLLATMCSLGLGHLVLACHRLIAETKIPPQEGAVEAAMNHTFSVEVQEVGTPVNMSFSTVDSEDAALEKYKPTWKLKHVSITLAGKIAVLTILLTTILVVIAGTFKETFNFEFKGLTGLLLGADSVAPYSLVTIGTTLPQASGAPHSFGVRWIQASYFAFGLGMPLAFCAALVIVWTVPLTIKLQKGLIVLTEVLNAWNALDVFVVSIVAALLEIQQFAKFLVGDSCDQINKVLKEHLDEELDGDDTCFDVVATLKTDAWMLYVAAGFLVIVGLPMMAVAHTVIAERMDAYQYKLEESSARGDDAEAQSICSNHPHHRERSTSMSAAMPPKLFATPAERDAAIASVEGIDDDKRVALLSGDHLQHMLDDASTAESRDHRVLTIDLTNEGPEQVSEASSGHSLGCIQGQVLDKSLSSTRISGTSLGHSPHGYGVEEMPSYGWSMKLTSFAVNSLHWLGMVRFLDDSQHPQQE